MLAPHLGPLRSLPLAVQGCRPGWSPGSHQRRVTWARSWDAPASVSPLKPGGDAGCSPGSAASVVPVRASSWVRHSPRPQEGPPSAVQQGREGRCELTCLGEGRRALNMLLSCSLILTRGDFPLILDRVGGSGGERNTSMSEKDTSMGCLLRTPRPGPGSNPRPLGVQAGALTTTPPAKAERPPGVEECQAGAALARPTVP